MELGDGGVTRASSGLAVFATFDGAHRQAHEGVTMSDAQGAPGDDTSLRVEDFDAAIFDLDGVVTRTARVHAAAWKRLFDEYLSQRAEREGKPFRPFLDSDYQLYVDGKPRSQGIVSFLESRGIALPRGTPSDPPDRATIYGLGNLKNRYFRESLEQNGVEAYDSTVALIRTLRGHGIRTALVSSSRNARAILAVADLTTLFDVCIDGTDAPRLELKGKPQPDIFLAAAEALGVPRERAAVFEDAISGVQAGRAGGFGLVVGVDRAGQAAALRKAGADLVVADLAALHLLPPTPPAGPASMERRDGR